MYPCIGCGQYQPCFMNSSKICWTFPPKIWRVWHSWTQYAFNVSNTHKCGNLYSFEKYL